MADYLLKQSSAIKLSEGEQMRKFLQDGSTVARREEGAKKARLLRTSQIQHNPNTTALTLLEKKAGEKVAVQSSGILIRS
jgi:hypothetical protein